MVLDRRTVERRLAELDEILAALASQEGEGLKAEDLEGDLSRRWRLERGLLAAANLILDVANHIAAAHYAAHPATYEQTLRELAARGVLEEATYDGLRGLGGFRNVLAHEYLEIDPCANGVSRSLTPPMDTAPASPHRGPRRAARSRAPRSASSWFVRTRCWSCGR